ncbi:uncharacterized protein LOC129725580 [Wyeomyia smithii]|uniref:uncharacterized protein LOC129725580 n=1 Tax=Wyeomyia smithii TaxID=174621 RepID=UPI0024680BE7|nr:uncharacterized protein LOC129725580 [Wyeomyia smithii]
MSTERRKKTLKLHQRSIVTSFNLIKTFVDSYDETRDVAEVPVRLENLVSLWTDFSKIQCELESLDEANLDDQLKQRADIESQYYKVKGFLLAVNKSPSTPSVTPSNISTAQYAPSNSNIRLPDVKLPILSGSLDSWLNFHDLYISLVHSSQDLSNIQKFYYLRSSVAVDALKLIQTIPLSANNYPVAWNLLVEHFQNTARLKQSYVDALFEFSPLKRESATELHSLVEKFEANVKILQQLGEKTEFWDVLLIRMLSTRLDPTTRGDWEEHSSTRDTVSFPDLTTFIQRRVTVLQTISGNTTEASSNAFLKRQPASRPFASHGATQFQSRKCSVCSEQHPLYMCAKFAKMDIQEKEKEVCRLQLCRNCLRSGHVGKDCSSFSSCKRCQGRHHTQLCQNKARVLPSESSNVSAQIPSSSSQQGELPPISFSAIQPQPTTHASATRKRTRVLLATAVVIVIDDNGTRHAARALLDSGSECCFATESFSQLIKVQRKKITIPIAGIGQSATQTKGKFSSLVCSRITDYSATVEFLVLPKVTVDLPATSVNIVPGRIALGDDLPTLVNSVFGWVVTGKNLHCSSQSPIIANVASVADVHQLMERFWKIEEDSTEPCYSLEEAACEEYFRRTVTRTTEGRYKVRLPLKKTVLETIGDNRKTAIRRFHLLENRLQRNPTLCKQYSDFMREYEDLDHMQRVTRDDSRHSIYHLPHHAVIKEESTTTKVRVVFDASCKTPKGPSLNDALLVGPIVQDDLRSIIMRSRIHPVMLIADIKQMYRQILVDKRDTPLQRIIWRNSPEDPLDTYELKTVTYGTASAPFLATRVLQKLADDEQNDFPEAASVLRKDFHVDDLFSGSSTETDAITLRNQLETILARGGFQLRKWASNKPAVLADISIENRAIQQSVDLDRGQCIKTLGIHWEPTTDILKYNVKLPKPDSTIALTKRIALSYIAQLFDPLGLVGPVVTTAKLFMQALWTLKDEHGNIWSWDRELPSTLQNRWTVYHTQLPHLNQLNINRGLCSDVYSDNGRNFIGAANELRKLIQSEQHRMALQQECASQGIRWHFNPPLASHFGGLWESAINSAQKHFLRILGNQTLSYVDTETLLSQIECCLNSRPLVPLSDDPTDFEPLTSGHFLIGSALKAVPDTDFTAIPFNRLKKWQQTQKKFQHIWNRWHREYLSTLQPRARWCNPPVQLAKDQLVILMNENLPPMQWPMARIEELHPGADGIVRVVTVRTPRGSYRRPVTKICLLPSSASDEQHREN